MTYLNDIIIISMNEKEHLKHIEIIFQKLVAAGVKLKESKCDFFQKRKSLFKPFHFRQGNTPSTWKVGQHTQYA